MQEFIMSIFWVTSVTVTGIGLCSVKVFLKVLQGIFFLQVDTGYARAVNISGLALTNCSSGLRKMY